MGFILKMAWRDSRLSRRRLVLYSFSIVLGIAALVAIGSFSANLRLSIDDQAKGLLGADFAVESRQALPPEAKPYFDTLGVARAREMALSSMIVFPGSNGQTRLVSIRALEPSYPFYGDFLTVPADAPQRLHAPGGGGAVLEETLMAQFGVKVGDPVKIGDKVFQVVGALRKMPGDQAALALLAPRVYIAFDDLAATGLAGAGSLVRHRIFYRLAPGVNAEALRLELRERYRPLRLRFDTVESRKRDLGRALGNVNSFLTLIGFCALFLGAIGVASAIHVYVRQKIGTVAILRCLGASARQSFAVYLLQGLALGVFGAVVGAAVGVAVQLALPGLARDFLPFDVAFTVSWAAVAQGMGAGLAICLLFTLLPLLSVRRIPPLAALRSSVVDQNGGRDPWRMVLFSIIVAAVAAFGVWQTGQWRLGLGFTGMLAVTFGLLAGLARVVAWAARRFFPRKASYVWRQGISNLHRPNNRTVLLLLSLGLGTFLLLTLALTRETLLAEVRLSGGSDRPNLMFFDIQDDQIGPLNDLLANARSPIRAQAPVVTMRIRAVNGRTVEDLLKDNRDRIPGWTLRREYRSTFREGLGSTEKLIAGEWVPAFDPATGEDVPISIEEGLAKDMQLKLGDRIEWDVQGLPMTTRIRSLRAVEWQRLQPNFFVVFPRGVLEAAPKFYLASSRAETPADSARVQQAVVQAFPNISAIDLSLILQTLDNIFTKVEYVVRFMALFTVATGALVLAGAVMTGRFQRIRETVLLRTLGATRRQLIRIQLVEYAALGFLGALTGGALAFVSTALLAVFVFETPVVAPAGYLAAAAGGVTLLTVATGFIANRGVATHPPLEVLRHET